MVAEIVIISPKYFCFELNTFRIGGVQTYIKDLSTTLTQNGMKVSIYQLDSQEQEMLIDGVLIKSAFIKRGLNRNKYQVLFNKIYSNKCVYIIATEQFDIKTTFKNVISIQHGIAFDIPGYMLPGLWKYSPKFQLMNKLLRSLRNVSRFNNSVNTVCVDYNYYNWYKTLGTIKDSHNVSIIMNYCSDYISIEDFEKKISQKKEITRVIFARRFVDYRGTSLFMHVAKKILDTYENIHITFAGEGPLRNEILKAFQNDSRVTLASFKAEDSVKFHSSYDIAVVPSLYSEGSSLSLCEAMAAGCFPIATHVGGMTNMLINMFNGLLTYPDQDELYKALSEAITMDREQFNKILNNAYNTAITAFSRKRWENEWLNVLNKLK